MPRGNKLCHRRGQCGDIKTTSGGEELQEIPCREQARGVVRVGFRVRVAVHQRGRGGGRVDVRRIDKAMGM